MNGIFFTFILNLLYWLDVLESTILEFHHFFISILCVIYVIVKFKFLFWRWNKEESNRIYILNLPQNLFTIFLLLKIILLDFFSTLSFSLFFYKRLKHNEIEFKLVSMQISCCDESSRASNMEIVPQVNWFFHSHHHCLIIHGDFNAQESKSLMLQRLITIS